MVEFTIWDVQHGSSMYIKSPNGKHITIDAGVGSYENRNTSFSPLLRLSQYYGVQQIDYAIITHPHKDHIEDLYNLIKLSPKVLCRPKHLTRADIITSQTSRYDIPLYEKYLEFCSGYNGSFSENDYRDPSNPSNFGGLEIQIFSPTDCSTSNLNNQSIISVFSYANCKVVIPGDNESSSYNELLQQSRFRKAIQNADVLIASHHGRESGYHDEFVELVNPRLTIISDDCKGETSAVNDYSYISRGWDVYSRYSGISCKRNTLSTYNDGVINIKIGYNGQNPFLNVNKR